MTEVEFVPVKLPSRVYDNIEKAVVNLFKELKITKVPIDPFDIARRKGYVLRQYSTLPRDLQIRLREKELEAVNYFDPDARTFVICYDDAIQLLRVRFTLMHEIGHITLGHREESELAKKMADYFAAYALAPSPLMGSYNCDDFMDVADTFDISQTCADICFQRFVNWVNYSGDLKMYENELLCLFHK